MATSVIVMKYMRLYFIILTTSMFLSMFNVVGIGDVVIKHSLYIVDAAQRPRALEVVTASFQYSSLLRSLRAQCSLWKGIVISRLVTYPKRA